MFIPQFLQCVTVRRNLGRIRLSSQCGGSDDNPTLQLNIAFQVSNGSTHTNEIINNQVFLPFYYITVKKRLPCKAAKAISTGMADCICLNNPTSNLKLKFFCKLFSKCLRYGVDPFAFHSVRTYEGGPSPMQ